MAVMGASLKVPDGTLLLQQRFGAEKAALTVTSRYELSNNAGA
jgi:hypothetical protein